jgi:polyhydroxyalkanoate synthesis regulator phasin
MINHFFLSESEHNERLIEVLKEKLTNGEMDEETAKRIAKDMWRPVKGKIFSSNKLKLAIINEGSI